MSTNHRTMEQVHQTPVFIIGNPRSGTTLLRVILTSHPKLGIPPETEFIVRLFPKYGHILRFDKKTLRKFFRDLDGGCVDLADKWKVDFKDLIPDTDDMIGASYADVCARFYYNYQQARGFYGKTFWGDKNTAHSNYLNVLSYLYPDARFVHIVRDGRAVLNSYKNLNRYSSHKYAPMLPKDSRTVSLRWIQTLERIERHLKHYAPEQYITVRYEDILRNFESEIERICEFIGLPYAEEMRIFNELNRKHELEPREFEWKVNTYNPLDPSKCDAWRDDLSSQHVAAFEELAWPMLDAYGYKLLQSSSGSKAPGLPRLLSLKERLREFLRSMRFRIVCLRTGLR